ncbi:MAG: LLM class oxidoreductase [Gammaproteobacteria bacterium]|nr:LLM class oxidoreductase [Gammaproteobacteria bacterium]MCF6260903.1 LLM class oxidoreductase [Gammaproteobacteria bacterium]
MNVVGPNQGYEKMFAPNQLTLGVFFAIESYSGSIPTMENQVALAKRAEALGFAALWFRDVPLHDPSFGDVGQIYDPWVYLGYIAAQTSSIALATGSIVFPLRHPIHLAKAAASVDTLSGGRLVLGVASGDRPVEYPAFNIDFSTRGERFRETLRYFKEALGNSFPAIESSLGHLNGVDLIPKPYGKRIPILITGHSQQSLEWIAENGDGWITYPRSLEHQANMVNNWRQLTEDAPDGFKPFSQSLYIDLLENPDTPPEPIHLGFKSGRNHLIEFLGASREAGVNHIVLNLKYGTRPAADVLEEIGQEVLPFFPAPNT